MSLRSAIFLVMHIFMLMPPPGAAARTLRLRLKSTLSP